MSSAAVVIVVGLAVAGAFLALLLLGTGDARLRGRNAWVWGVVLVFGGPPGWVLWAVVAVVDRLRGRRGLVDPPGASRLENLAAVLATAALAAALALGVLPVSATVTSASGRAGTVACGSAALVVAGASDPAASQGIGGYVIGGSGDGASTLDREVAACALTAGRRVALAWSLFALSSVLLGVPLLEARAVVRGGGVPGPVVSGGVAGGGVAGGGVAGGGRSLAFRLGSVLGRRRASRGGGRDAGPGAP